VENSVWSFNCEADRDQENERRQTVDATRTDPRHWSQRLIVVPLLLLDHPFCFDLNSYITVSVQITYRDSFGLIRDPDTRPERPAVWYLAIDPVPLSL
jgi:hypothetical protein